MKNEALLNAIIENAIDGIITINEFGIIETINPSACRLFQYKAEEVIGKNVSMLMPSPDRERHDSYLANYRNTGVPHIIGYGRDVLARKKDGSVFPFRLGVGEVRFEGKRIFAGFIHDLSHQKEVERRLMEYTQHLEELVKERTVILDETISALTVAKEEVSLSLEKEKELGKLKSRLLSMASHEFRTPLSSIQLSTALIERYAATFESSNISKHVNKIKSAINNLITILDDFLHVEKAEAGKVEVSFSQFDIILFAKEIVDEMQLLSRPGQTIVFDHVGSTSVVNLDKNLLKNCIINLMSNAIKYSGENTIITFNTYIKDTSYRISISDNGIGIPTHEQKHLFEAFFRAQNTENIPGTGLGLNIVERYVKLMNGTIDFESTSGKGTTFTISIPIHD